MIRKFFFAGTLIVVMIILAACGTAAKPAYEADELISQAQETAASNEEMATEEAVATEEVATEEAVATEEVATEEAVATEEVATEEAVVTEEVATEEAVVTEEVATEEAASSADDPLTEAIAAANPTNGEQLFLMNGCAGCHTVDSSEMVIVGPGQYNLINRAGERVEGQGPYTYIYNSIVNPNDHVVEGFAAGIMPPSFGDLLTDEQIYDLIAYFATLHD
jgi:mono/diheme cytochrome c family protein